MHVQGSNNFYVLCIRSTVKTVNNIQKCLHFICFVFIYFKLNMLLKKLEYSSNISGFYICIRSTEKMVNNIQTDV